MVDQALDRAEAGACAKWTLAGVTRAGATGLLIAAAVIGALLASLLTIDLPVPAGWGGDGAAGSFVPASDRWIDLGAPRAETPPTAAHQADRPQRMTASDHALAPSHHETQTRSPRKSRALSNPQFVGAQNHDGDGRFAANTGARRS